MHNFPYSQNPKVWEEYYGHAHAKSLAAKFIGGGSKTMPRSMFISGPSGTGKTAFARLLIKSMRCLNRPDDSINPCNECAHCKGRDERIADGTQTDVYWIQPGGFSDEEGLTAQVKQALYRASKGQVRTDRPDRDMLFVVFDEWQTFPSNLRQQVLLRAEVEVDNNNVCYLFITMQEEKLPVEERIALIRRGNPIKLLPFGSEEVSNFLTNKFANSKYPLDTEVARAIAEVSYGSIGLSLALYDNIAQQDPSVSMETACLVLNVLQDSQREEIWNALKAGQPFSYFNKLFEGLLKYASAEEIVRQLIQDLLYSMDIVSPTQSHFFALSLLNQYQLNPGTSPVPLLMELTKFDLVHKDGIYRHQQSKSLLKPTAGEDISNPGDNTAN